MSVAPAPGSATAEDPPPATSAPPTGELCLRRALVLIRVDGLTRAPSTPPHLPWPAQHAGDASRLHPRSHPNLRAHKGAGGRFGGGGRALRPGHPDGSGRRPCEPPPSIRPSQEPVPSPILVPALRSGPRHRRRRRWRRGVFPPPLDGVSATPARQARCLSAARSPAGPTFTPCPPPMPPAPRVQRSDEEADPSSRYTVTVTGPSVRVMECPTIWSMWL